MKETIGFAKITFDGIYFWGKGWKDAETYNKWKTFWSNINYGNKVGYWKYFLNDGFHKTEYLVSTLGSIYLHPMGFDCVLKGCGVTCNGKHFTGKWDELYNLCKEVSELCGGTFTMEISEEKEIPIEMTTFNVA